MLQGVFIVKVVDMISVLSHSGQLMAEGSESSESESDLLHLNMDDMSVQSGILWITFATVEKEKLSTHGRKIWKETHDVLKKFRTICAVGFYMFA